MKSISRLDEWSLTYFEHGMDGETKTTFQQTLIATNDKRFHRRAITKSVRINLLLGPD